MKPHAISLPVFVPAFAMVPTHLESGSRVHGWLDYTLERRLRQRGIAAASVEEQGALIRAFVTNPDGTLGLRFFNPVTLAAVVPFLG